LSSPVIDEFMGRYLKEYDFYREASRLCAQRCEIELEQSGIRAIVTHRAKRPDRLRDKVTARSNKGPYNSVEALYGDLVDLAGVRIALYFPGNIDEVERLLSAAFDLEQKKCFPDEAGPPSYEKRFSGYAARHYRVRLQQSGLGDLAVRYADARIEIQVASVLIHAWAEVEHDLVYKPMSGTLSQDEYAILDELNGLVLTGEIALERLQRAGELRLQRAEASFSNHYELANYIYGRVAETG